MTDISDTPRNRGVSNAPHLSPATPAEDARTILINKVSWGAVLAGVVVALVTQLVLNLLGIGIGAATLDPGTGDNPSAASFSIGAGLWFALSGILAALAGGYAAGRLAGKPKESTAGWHGLTTWALTTLVIFYLLTSSVGGILGGAYRTVTSALGNVASAVGSTAQTAAQVAAPNLSRMDPFSSIEQSLRGATGGNDPAALRDSAIAAVRAALTGDPNRHRTRVNAQLRQSRGPRASLSTRRARRSSSTSSNTARRSSRRSSRRRRRPRRQPRPSRGVRFSAPSAFCLAQWRVGLAAVWAPLSRPSLGWACVEQQRVGVAETLIERTASILLRKKFGASGPDH